MNFHEEMEQRVEMVNALLESAFCMDAGKAQYLLDAMKYSVMGSGKRIRPIIMDEAAKLFNRKPVEIPEFMIALELIHSYSLVHDDMPCLDNDEYRRGNLTTHAKYGEPTALLVGDGLLNMAYEEVSLAMECSPKPRLCAKAFAVLARCAGLFGMVGGQACDVWYEKNRQPISAETLEYIHENKTGALLGAAFLVGGILGGAKEEELAVLSHIAVNVGVAFQIQDDILDVEGNFEELGKPIGSDEKLGKETYVTIHGMDKAKKDVRELSEEALSLLQSFRKRNEFLEELIKSMICRNR